MPPKVVRKLRPAFLTACRLCRLHSPVHWGNGQLGMCNNDVGRSRGTEPVYPLIAECLTSKGFPETTKLIWVVLAKGQPLA
jgi:hypothetical protein